MHNIHAHTQTRHPFSYTPMFSHTHPSALPFHTHSSMTCNTHTHTVTHPHSHSTHAYIHAHAHVHTHSHTRTTHILISHTRCNTYTHTRTQAHSHPGLPLRPQESEGFSSFMKDCRCSLPESLGYRLCGCHQNNGSRFQALGSRDCRQGSHVPSTSGKAGGNEAGTPTERISSAGCWRHDIVPGRRESVILQAHETVHSSTAVDRGIYTAFPQAGLGVVRQSLPVGRHQASSQDGPQFWMRQGL